MHPRTQYYNRISAEIARYFVTEIRNRKPSLFAFTTAVNFQSHKELNHMNAYECTYVQQINRNVL